MISPRVRFALFITAGLVIGAWAVHAVARTTHFDPRDELQAGIKDTRDDIARYQQALDDAPRVAETLRGFADRTLGGDLETVDHRLRTRLNRIAESLGLSRVTVGTGAMRGRLSPARNEFRGRYRELREEVDLVELDGWINGEGRLEQALRVLDVIDAEPWLKRVNQYKLESKDEGRRIAVSVRLTTVFMPGLEPRVVPARAYDPAPFGRFGTIVERNPFALPVTQASEPSPPKPAPRRDPDAAWKAWRLTGVAQGPDGPEVWLLNERSSASHRMTVGEHFRDLVLVEVDGARAVFRIGEERFVLTLGQTLSDRSGPTE